MGWRILYIEEAEKLSLYLDNIKIVKKGINDVIIPLADIHTLILDNYMLSVTVQLLNKCCEYNINLIMCSIDHMPSVIVNPYSGNKQAPLQLRKQLQWDINAKRYLHQIIIKNKIRNQRRLLEYLQLDIEVINKLISFENEVELGDIHNREGLSAKMYFKELFGNQFRRFSEDKINAGLDYGYSILRSQITKTLISKGLNPIIGIFHKGPENQFNLSDDIIEPFRPIIDTYCFKVIKNKIGFTKENKLDLIKLTTINIKYGNTYQSFFNVLVMYIDSILYFLETGDDSRILDIVINYEKV